MKRVIRKIIKTCKEPEEFCFDYINGASVEADIRRMKEYVKCVKRVEKGYKKSFLTPKGK